MPDADSKLVLIVEDTADLAQFVEISIREMGFESFHAIDAETAINFLEDHTPDLILLDIGLPGMSGWELLDIIYTLREQEKIFVVITTAFQDPANRLIGKLQEVDGYLHKPFPYSELQKVVMGLFESSTD